ncbi:MAG: flagellar basal-body MS-ring/collar protein FliF [Betaproteobacteria bacterium]|jgi:flagellar M-ring protein FliF
MATASATMNTSVTDPAQAQLSGPSPVLPGPTAPPGSSLLRPGDLARAVGNQMLTDPMGMVKDMVRQPTVKKLLPLFVIMFVLAAFGLASMNMKATPMKPLTMMLSDADKQVAMEALRTAEFKPELDMSSGQIMVPESKYQEARMLIASKGLPRTEVQGIDGLKDMPAMTTSQFMEQVRYNNAMEQELARSISQIAGIKSARVHLAAPKQSVFVRDRVPTKASVVITRSLGKAVSSANVSAIIQLVASSVPYLAPENVSVIDNFGSLMNEMLTEQPLGLTSAQLQQKQQMEDLYRTRLIQLLAPIVGEINVSAQVSMSMDFNQQEITTEDFDQRDKGPKTRSELYVEDRATFKDAIGIPGSLTNTPPNPPQNPAATPDTTADITKGVTEKGVQTIARSTKNYELDRSVRHTKTAMGTIQKIGVGVLINERPIPAGMKVEKPADGVAPTTTIPYTQEELDRLNQLVRGAVGYNEQRGDVVTVISTRFEPQIDPDAMPWYKDETIAGVANSSVIAVLFLLFLVVVVRPMVRKLTAPPFDAVAMAAAATEAAAREAAANEKIKAERIAEAVAAAAAKVVADRAAAEEAAEAERLRLLDEARLQAQQETEERMRMEAQEAERVKKEEEAAQAAADLEASDEIEIEEGESMEEIKARMSHLKPKKPSISADMLNTANTYDDKVALIRMIVSEENTRARMASVLKNMIK